MTIIWNKVTWYSKFAAVIFFFVIFPVWAFIVGMKFEDTLHVIREVDEIPVFVYPGKENIYE
ncbi:MAG: hypothetical protein V4519_04415 [Patescibacteria group bacterium]